MYACPGVKGAAGERGQLMADSCVVSKALLKDLKQRAVTEGRAAADEALRQRRNSNTAASTTAQEGKLTYHSCN